MSNVGMGTEGLSLEQIAVFPRCVSISEGERIGVNLPPAAGNLLSEWGDI